MQLNSTVLEIGKYMYIIIILLPSGGHDSFRNVNCPSVMFQTAKNFEWRVYRVKQQLEYYLHIKLLYLTD